MENQLFFVFQNEIKGSLVTALRTSSLVDFSEEVSLALEAVVEEIHGLVLVGLNQKAESENGAAIIEQFIEKGGHKGQVLQRIDEIFTEETIFLDHKKLGNSLLDFVFEDNEDPVLEKFQQQTSVQFSVPMETVIDLYQIVLPFSMGVIGKQVQEVLADPTALKKELKQSAAYINQRFPDIAQLYFIPEQVVQSESEAVNPEFAEPSKAKNNKAKSESENKTDNGGLHPLDIKIFYKNFFPWLATFIVAAGSLYALRYFEHQEDQAVPVLEAKNNPFDFIKNDSLDVQSLTALPVANSQKAMQGNEYEDSLAEFIQDKSLTNPVRFSNTDLQFENNSPNISLKGKAELDEVLSVLKKFDFLHLDIVVDGAPGQKNNALLQQRMKNVQDYFIVFGIAKERLSVQYQFDQLKDMVGKDSLTSPIDTNQITAKSTAKAQEETAIHFNFSNQDKNI